MAEYIETVLPSGRGVRIEAMKTSQYLVAQKRAAQRTPNGSESEMAIAFSEEAIKVALRAYTNVLPEILEEVTTEVDGKKTTHQVPNVDAMLDAATAENAWQPVTHEELIIKDGPRSLMVLFDQPADFISLAGLVGGTLAPGQGRLAAVAGKKRTVSAAP